MSNFDKAIEIILAEPPEMHYPAYYADLLSKAYYADLLREADVTGKNVGKCSEIPNSSDTISRQAAIDEIGEWIKAFRENGHKESAADARLIQDGIIQLPSAQPETAKRIVGKSRDGMTLWYQCDMCNEPVDEQDNYCRGCGRRLIDG